ncbi:HD domain-containing protein [Clostridium tyrobutyricum]|uniref:HD domain-containing protein n=1 Tax=Clostridium tyrobutyricum TaxID=1519 RepID=UPI001C392FCE|nr:HD domain-containing protein [Clostridium tyrobutyricum]MBV4445331.1 HD domain-containing protein [Clostridium tyrobutyricum]MBV4445464.1 HD domain-containing protein [Clostridium tyrobutyricum]
MKPEEIKEKIIKLLSSTERKGIDKVIKYLESSDFFEAPASTRYHGNYKGGLAEHSLNVYEIFKKKNEIYDFGLSDDTVKITALLHDTCKTNFYTVSSRNMKKDGKWIKVPYYAVDDQVPFGHGEKSVILLQQFIRLSKEEVIIIRWHMGGYEPKENYNYISNSWNICKAGVALHTADLESSYILETHFEPGESTKQMSFKA